MDGIEKAKEILESRVAEWNYRRGCNARTTAEDIDTLYQAEIERLKEERQSSIDATNFWANEHRKLLDKYHILESGLASQPTAQQILDHSKPIQIPEQMREKIAKRS